MGAKRKVRVKIVKDYGSQLPEINSTVTKLWSHRKFLHSDIFRSHMETKKNVRVQQIEDLFENAL